jgi:hypothetical protein
MKFGPRPDDDSDEAWARELDLIASTFIECIESMRYSKLQW